MKRRYRTAMLRIAVAILVLVGIAVLEYTHAACVADFGPNSIMCVD